MKELEEFLKKEGIYPRIDFEDKELHTFEILKGKVVDYEDGDSGFKLLVREEGELRIITTPSVLLEVRKCKEGEIWQAQLHWSRIGDRPIRNYEVKKVDEKKEKKEAQKEEGKIKKDEEIPKVEDEGEIDVRKLEL